MNVSLGVLDSLLVNVFLVQQPLLFLVHFICRGCLSVLWYNTIVPGGDVDLDGMFVTMFELCF